MNPFSVKSRFLVALFCIAAFSTSAAAGEQLEGDLPVGHKLVTLTKKNKSKGGVGNAKPPTSGKIQVIQKLDAARCLDIEAPGSSKLTVFGIKVSKFPKGTTFGVLEVRLYDPSGKRSKSVAVSGSPDYTFLVKKSQENQLQRELMYSLCEGNSAGVYRINSRISYFTKENAWANFPANPAYAHEINTTFTIA